MTFDGDGEFYNLLPSAYNPTPAQSTLDHDCQLNAPTDIRSFTVETWRERIGIVFQDPILFAGTIHENIAYGSPDATRHEVEEAARQANCDFIWGMPQGFDTPSTSTARFCLSFLRVFPMFPGY